MDETLVSRYVTLLQQCEAMQARVVLAKQTLDIWLEIDRMSPNAMAHLTAQAVYKAQARLADLEHRHRMLLRARRIMVRSIVSDLAAGLTPLPPPRNDA